MDEQSSKEVTRLIIRHQQQIYAYIYSILPYREAAEDALQETCVTICEKFSEFQQGSNFVAWANTIALWKVRQAKLRFTRSRLVFSDDVCSSLLSTYESLGDELGKRHEALDKCLGKLNEKDRKFVMARYQRGQGVADAAKQTGRSIQAAYKALTRIRKSLTLCVETQLNLPTNS